MEQSLLNKQASQVAVSLLRATITVCIKANFQLLINNLKGRVICVYKNQSFIIDNYSLNSNN